MPGSPDCRLSETVEIDRTKLYSDCMTDADQRKYQMRKRREDIEATRRRIVEATVELHGSVGPAQTTFSAVAERAGVQRSTVYRHFADEEALFGACTSHWLAAHPWPRHQDWAQIADPAERLQRGLGEMYRYYAENEQMIANSFRDIEVMPPFVGEFMRAQIGAIHATLMEPWGAVANAGELAAALALAIDFRAWKALADAGLTAQEAAALVTRMVAAIPRV